MLDLVISSIPPNKIVRLLMHSASVVSSEDRTHTTSTISGKHQSIFFTTNIRRSQTLTFPRWKPFDPSRNFPDLGPRFKAGEDLARATLRREKLQALVAAARSVTTTGPTKPIPLVPEDQDKDLESDKRDLDWSTVMKRTFEGYVRGERPNMYGEWIEW